MRDKIRELLAQNISMVELVFEGNHSFFVDLRTVDALDDQLCKDYSVDKERL